MSISIAENSDVETTASVFKSPGDMDMTSLNWQLAAIQHEIFLRVFPAVRHDIIGPISVSRMGITVLKRSLQKNDLAKDSILQQLAKIDEQMQLGVEGIRELKLWDVDASAVADPALILAQGIKLMAYRLHMRGIAIEFSTDEYAAERDTAKVKQQAFLYCWLALLAYFEDNLVQAATLQIKYTSPRALAINIVIDDDAHQVMSTELPLNSVSISQQALLLLLGQHAVSVRFSANSLSMHW